MHGDGSAKVLYSEPCVSLWIAMLANGVSAILARATLELPVWVGRFLFSCSTGLVDRVAQAVQYCLDPRPRAVMVRRGLIITWWTAQCCCIVPLSGEIEAVPSVFYSSQLNSSPCVLLQVGSTEPRFSSSCFSLVVCFSSLRRVLTYSVMHDLRAAWFFLYLIWSFHALADSPDNCSCGFYDDGSGKLFTDSIIVYFNETTSLPSEDFLAESYVNKYEYGWNSVYRQAADPANVALGNGSSTPPSGTPSMQLVVSPATNDHVVFGGAIRTLRQDIRYGTFRAMMKSPGMWKGGSALSMMLQYNQTSRVTLNLQNSLGPSAAWLSNLINNEFPKISLGVNYTNISRPDREYGATNPWGFNEIKVDWTPEYVNYFINSHPTRMVNGTASDGSDRPTTPAPFTLKHWSVGDPYSMAGPPLKAPSEAEVQWVRLFFNTSTMPDDVRKNFDSSCNKVPTCSVDDMTLRGSTPHPPEATQAWVAPDSGYMLRWWAVGVGSFGLTISVLVILNVILRKVLMPKPKASQGSPPSTSVQPGSDSGVLLSHPGSISPIAFQPSPFASRCATPTTPAYLRDPIAGSGTLVSQTPVNITRPPSPSPTSGEGNRTATRMFETRSRPRSLNDLLIQQMPLPPFACHSPAPRSQPPLTQDSRTMSVLSSMSGGSNTAGSFLGRAVEGISYGPALPIEDLGGDEVARGGVPQSRTNTIVGSRSSTMVSSPAPAALAPPPVQPPTTTRNVGSLAPAAPRTRVDYLAGLVGVCSLLVSLTHFMLTFVPATIQPGAFAHYESEVWASKTIGPFLFNEVWVVIFFTTSTRFLTTKYLRSGDLSTIAEKVVGRVFRLMIPIVGVILLEYFLMDVGAINWLQYLPSVSWSTWVYTTVFPNFGSFINETLQLIYIIPNAMPSITFNYCTGVLWTIPVQIQGSWQAMLGVIIVREIKTPWKRFGYYAVCILLHWYARSWGSFFMAGLLLADLDITFKYRKWLYARPLVYYPLLNLAILITLLALGNDITAAWTGFDFTTLEAGWHPSRPTGLFRVQDVPIAFPPYFYPKLNGLAFAVGAQLVVEWSRWVQRAIATPLFLRLFPHIFTIYLFHGFVFWSVGAWICVGLANWGVPYWANMLVTCVGSYAALFACLPLVTPVVEALGKTLTADIWRAASERPPKKHPTLFPFAKDLFTCRRAAASDDGSSTAGSTSSVERAEEKGEKGKKLKQSLDVMAEETNPSS